MFCIFDDHMDEKFEMSCCAYRKLVRFYSYYGLGFGSPSQREEREVIDGNCDWVNRKS